jgi:hypothetical protein
MALLTGTEQRRGYEMPAKKSHLTMPVGVPCVGRTLGLITKQVRSCSSVRRAWISTVVDGVEEPGSCVVIELDPNVTDEHGVLRSIVEPLTAFAAEIGSEEDLRTSEDVVRDELLDFAWFVADDRMLAELSDGAGIAFHP